MRLSWLILLVIVASAAGLSRPVAAQGVAPSGYPADEPAALSAELRFRIFTGAYRWSSYIPEASAFPESGKQSLHAVFGLGARFYPKNAHGVLADVEYRLDMDVDTPWLCIFECPPQLWTELVVAHVGYAYRYVIPGPRDPGRLAWAFTPHASIAAGSSFSEHSDNRTYSETMTSPVVGARFGIDVDLHINRFFMGWTLRYEFLKHTRGPLDSSHFLTWNVIPVFLMGAVLGAKVQTQAR